MTPARLQNIEELFASAVARSAEERDAFLEEACAGDASLRREVKALLAADSETDDFAQIASGVAAEWTATNDHRDLVGQTFGRYKIIAPLAEGGMGEVFLAEDLTLHRKAAIKFLPRKFTRDADRLRRFEQEARAVSALNHPNIITIYEVGQWDSTHFIASEFIEGETLNEKGQNGRLRLDEVLEIGCQTAGALAAAHAAGIVHRDIKPANIMLRRDGYIKVLDFGLAKLSSAAAPQLDVTEAGRVMGTVNYMSPEQALGKPLDHRTDIFSLGVVLYEIATGSRLFAGDSEAATYNRILNQEPPPLRKVDPALPEELDLVLRRALEKNPERRYQSATDFRNDLRRLVSGSEQTEAAKLAFTRARARRSSRSWRVAAVAALLLALAAGVFFVGERTAENPGATLPHEIAPKSIAVLPFEDRSDHRENAYFAAGIQDEILTRLSKIADLKVISRTSTQHYKSAPKNLPQIAKQLGVAHILLGSVQKSGEAVRVNVQLINAANDSHLWAETYDRRLTDIFSVESEVAKAIAEQLRAQLSGQEEQVIAAKSTDSPEAYDAYLRGLAYSLKTTDTSAIVEAQKYLREAVRLDPEFALAWALLSLVDARGYVSLYLQPTVALREEARHAAETALTLQPNLGEAILAMGQYHYGCLKDYDTAVRYFEQARQFLPNSSQIPESLAYIERRRGQWDRCESYFNQAERLDPRNVRLLTQRAGTYDVLRRFPESLRKLDQVLHITPDALDIVVAKAAIAQAEGDLPRAAVLLAPLQPAADDPTSIERQVYQAILERRPAPVIPRLKEILAKPDPALGYLNGELRFWLGWAQEVAGDRAAARESWRQARSELEPFLQEQPENHNLIRDLALTNAGLGDKAAALALAERAQAAIPIEKDAFIGPGPIEILARVAAQLGEPDRAIAALQKVLSIPYGGALSQDSTPLTPALLRLDPMFDALRDDPRFQKLCEEAW